MSAIIHYQHCPVCGSSDTEPVLKARDHTVSGETFEIRECHSCLLRFTQDVPGPEAIQPYYKSENYISHTNTGKGLINRVYRVVRKHTLKKKRRLAEEVSGLKKGVLLDIGSGTGSYVREMQEAGWEVTGLEPDPGARQVALQQFGVQLVESQILFSLPPDRFDVISLWHVLEHVHDLHRYFDQMKKLLKENGRILVAVPNYTSFDATLYGSSWAAYDVPRHLYHFSPASMKFLAEKHGFRLLDMHPMWYDSFYISMLSSRYIHGKTNLLASFFNGLRSNRKAWKNPGKCSSVIYVLGK